MKKAIILGVLAASSMFGESSKACLARRASNPSAPYEYCKTASNHHRSETTKNLFAGFAAGVKSYNEEKARQDAAKAVTVIVIVKGN